jgi:hypothetical protein
LVDLGWFLLLLGLVSGSVWSRYFYKKSKQIAYFFLYEIKTSILPRILYCALFPREVQSQFTSAAWAGLVQSAGYIKNNPNFLLIGAGC